MTTPISDWAGNEIKDGDTVQFVAIGQDKSWKIILEFTFNRRIIFDYLLFVYQPKDQIRCIKGVSDNQEAFYLKYFKVN